MDRDILKSKGVTIVATWNYTVHRKRTVIRRKKRRLKNQGKWNLVVANQSLVTTVTQAIPRVLQKIFFSNSRVVRNIRSVTIHCPHAVSFVLCIMLCTRVLKSLFLYTSAQVSLHRAYVWAFIGKIIRRVGGKAGLMWSKKNQR